MRIRTRKGLQTSGAGRKSQKRPTLFVGKKAYVKSRMKLATLQETKSTIRFSAKLFRPKATEKIGSWTLLTLPNNASAKLPSGGMTMVEGTINGFPFRAALEPNGPVDQGANGSTQSPCSCPAGAGIVGGYHTNRAPGLDSLGSISAKKDFVSSATEAILRLMLRDFS
jgi:Domain of unknown function (DUF1905)